MQRPVFFGRAGNRRPAWDVLPLRRMIRPTTLKYLKEMTMKKDFGTPNTITRRRLLARVGLVAGAAYAAPAMVGLNAAHASTNSGASGGSSGASGGNSGASGGGNSGPSNGGSSGPSNGRGSRPGRARRSNGDGIPLWLERLLQGR